MLSVRGSGGGLNCGLSVVLLSLSGDGLLLIDREVGGTGRHGQQGSAGWGGGEWQ
jgi:hypothetical protein